MGFYDDLKKSVKSATEKVNSAIEQGSNMTLKEIGSKISDAVSSEKDELVKKAGELKDVVSKKLSDDEDVQVIIEVDEDGNEYEVIRRKKRVHKSEPEEEQVKVDVEVESDSDGKSVEVLDNEEKPDGFFKRWLDKVEDSVVSKAESIKEKRRLEEEARKKSPLDKIKGKFGKLKEKIDQSNRSELINGLMYIVQSKNPYSGRRAKNFNRLVRNILSILTAKQIRSIILFGMTFLLKNHYKKLFWVGGIATALFTAFSIFDDD
jgi:hypothetical protein